MSRKLATTKDPVKAIADIKGIVDCCTLSNVMSMERAVNAIKDIVAGDCMSPHCACRAGKCEHLY